MAEDVVAEQLAREGRALRQISAAMKRSAFLPLSAKDSSGPFLRVSDAQDRQSLRRFIRKQTALFQKYSSGRDPSPVVVGQTSTVSIILILKQCVFELDQQIYSAVEASMPASDNQTLIRLPRPLHEQRITVVLEQARQRQVHVNRAIAEVYPDNSVKACRRDVLVPSLKNPFDLASNIGRLGIYPSPFHLGTSFVERHQNKNDRNYSDQRVHRAANEVAELTPSVRVSRRACVKPAPVNHSCSQGREHRKTTQNVLPNCNFCACEHDFPPVAGARVVRIVRRRA